MRCIIVENKRIIVICTGHNHDFSVCVTVGSRQSKIQPYRPNVNSVNVRRRWKWNKWRNHANNQANPCHNLTIFTSAVAQLLSANAISSCILYENKVKLTSTALSLHMELLQIML